MKNNDDFELTTKEGIHINGLSSINESNQMHYLIYKITNLKNGKYYIGQHMTRNPLDSYMGSGDIIWDAVKKYGTDSFVKTILFDYDNYEDMDAKERELVQLSNCFPYDKMSYNLREGGSRGVLTPEAKKKIGKKSSKRNKGKGNPMFGHSVTDFMNEDKARKWRANVVAANKRKPNDPKWIKKMSEVTSGKNNPMYGEKLKDHMSPEEYEKWRKHLSEAASGENNTMYGEDIKDHMSPEAYARCLAKRSKAMKGRVSMINDFGVVKRVKKKDVKTYENMGFVLKKNLTKDQITERKSRRNTTEQTHSTNDFSK